jgi:hypothetical protein
MRAWMRHSRNQIVRHGNEIGLKFRPALRQEGFSSNHRLFLLDRSK